MNKMVACCVPVALAVGLASAVAGQEEELAPSADTAARLQPGDSFSDTLRSGGHGPEMVVIPAGSFQMGCVSGLDCLDSEKPVHTVTIAQPLAVSKFEITFEDYGRFANPTQVDDRGWGRGRRPVIHVSWTDAKQFAAWLSSQTGHQYRLLTEAEWEYAARSGSTTKYHFGDNEFELCHYANFDEVPVGPLGYGDALCSDGVGEKTAIVGRYAPNAFGLHDMHGNVWEWVEDCWNRGYSGAPSDGSAWIRRDCYDRVLRGGSWELDSLDARSASRFRSSPGTSDSSLGFRVARTFAP